MLHDFHRFPLLCFSCLISQHIFRLFRLLSNRSQSLKKSYCMCFVSWVIKWYVLSLISQSSGHSPFFSQALVAFSFHSHVEPKAEITWHFLVDWVYCTQLTASAHIRTHFLLNQGRLTRTEQASQKPRLDHDRSFMDAAKRKLINEGINECKISSFRAGAKIMPCKYSNSHC